MGAVKLHAFFTSIDDERMSASGDSSYSALELFPKVAAHLDQPRPPGSPTADSTGRHAPAGGQRRAWERLPGGGRGRRCDEFLPFYTFSPPPFFPAFARSASRAREREPPSGVKIASTAWHTPPGEVVLANPASSAAHWGRRRAPRRSRDRNRPPVRPAQSEPSRAPGRGKKVSVRFAEITEGLPPRARGTPGV